VDERARVERDGARGGEPGDSSLDAELVVVCRQVVELVTDYLEGALPPQLHDAVERHLALCPPCVVYVEQMRTTSAAVREVPVESIDARTRGELVSAFRDLVPRSLPRGEEPA
jgi:anti-sigma factor RsiW